MRIGIHRLFFALCVLAALLHIVWASQQLPEHMASHFGGSGQANGWSDRGGFIVIYSVMVAGLAIMFAVLAAAMPRLPSKAFNIPNPQYWLAPERAAATRRWMGDQLLQCGGATLLFMTVTLQATVAANASDPPRLPAWFWLGFVAYLVYALVWTVKLFLATRLPKS